jgi:hypothetical protein
MACESVYMYTQQLVPEADEQHELEVLLWEC